MASLQCIRSFRIFNIALFDFVMAFLGLYYLLRWLKPNRPRHYYLSWSILLVLPVSVVSHIAFDVPTTFNYYLGLSSAPIR